MKKKYFADFYGNTASISESGSGFKLVCRDVRGKVWKRSEHVSEKAAKASLYRTGDGWHSTPSLMKVI